MSKTLKKIVTKIKNLHVSLAQLTSSWNKVRRELWAMGFLVADSPLDEVECFLEPPWTSGGVQGLGKVMGLYYPMAMEGGDGNIHVPAICSAAILGYEPRIMVDVLRHEYGHALEDKYPRYFHGREFKRAFGKEYGTERSGDEEADHFVSDYAMESTQEDFAETFMYYMKHKGEIPKKWSSNRAICAKWTFVDGLCAKFAEAFEEP